MQDPSLHRHRQAGLQVPAYRHTNALMCIVHAVILLPGMHNTVYTNDRGLNIVNPMGMGLRMSELPDVYCRLQ